MSSHDSIHQQEQIFKSLNAWFSNSVQNDIKALWVLHGGKEIAVTKDANFLFTSEPNSDDVQRIFQSPEFLGGFLCVFHSSYITACLDEKSAHKVPAAQFIVLPADMPEDIKNLAFVQDHTDHSSKAEKLRKLLSAQASIPSCSTDKTTTQSITCHSGSGDNISEKYFGISDISTIPHVRSQPRAKGHICDFTPGINGFSVSLKA